jgi:hypothetical protein
MLPSNTVGLSGWKVDDLGVQAHAFLEKVVAIKFFLW